MGVLIKLCSSFPYCDIPQWTSNGPLRDCFSLWSCSWGGVLAMIILIVQFKFALALPNCSDENTNSGFPGSFIAWEQQTFNAWWKVFSKYFWRSPVGIFHELLNQILVWSQSEVSPSHSIATTISFLALSSTSAVEALEIEDVQVAQHSLLDRRDAPFPHPHVQSQCRYPVLWLLSQ